MVGWVLHDVAIEPKMRVCVVDLSGPFGPLRSYLGLAPELRRLGVTFEFVVPEHSLDLVLFAVPEATMRVVSSRHSFRRDLEVARAVRRSVQTGSVVVHANTTSASRGASLGAVGLRSPLVVHLRNSSLSARERALLVVTVRAFNDVRLLAVSEAAAAVAGSTIGFRSTIVRDPIPPIPIRPDRGLGPVARIGVVVNQQPTKGFDVFAETAALLRDLPVHWDVYGSAGVDPPANDFVADARRVVARAGLEDQVTYHGPVQDLVGRYSQMDAVLVTSRRESFSLVCAEAMRAGTPLVAPRIPGLLETIRGGQFAATYRAADAEDAAEVIREVLRSYPDALRRADEARTWAGSEFDPHRLALQVYEVYRHR